ncbi:hypothetical protein AVEN_87385-1 [Araneus ventricosus]|uniref:Uncharacterized protein n=1 Tax=Araneus ventricosus TaxID=182803 RepID=A0A4Y2IDJ5_ARAVE|nr:hypothetical protein AVEN_87385-1 [Araneus ventricosus]
MQYTLVPVNWSAHLHLPWFPKRRYCRGCLVGKRHQEAWQSQRFDPNWKICLQISHIEQDAAIPPINQTVIEDNLLFRFPEGLSSFARCVRRRSPTATRPDPRTSSKKSCIESRASCHSTREGFPFKQYRLLTGDFFEGGMVLKKEIGSALSSTFSLSSTQGCVVKDYCSKAAALFRLAPIKML